MGKVVRLKENQLVGGNSETPVYPITATNAVYREGSNKTLESILDDLQRDLQPIHPNNGKLTIKQGQDVLGEFTADQDSNTVINIPEQESQEIKNIYPVVSVISTANNINKISFSNDISDTISTLSLVPTIIDNNVYFLCDIKCSGFWTEETGDNNALINAIVPSKWYSGDVLMSLYYGSTLPLNANKCYICISVNSATSYLAGDAGNSRIIKSLIYSKTKTINSNDYYCYQFSPILINETKNGSSSISEYGALLRCEIARCIGNGYAFDIHPSVIVQEEQETVVSESVFYDFLVSNADELYRALAISNGLPRQYVQNKTRSQIVYNNNTLDYYGYNKYTGSDKEKAVVRIYIKDNFELNKVNNNNITIDLSNCYLNGQENTITLGSTLIIKGKTCNVSNVRFDRGSNNTTLIQLECSGDTSHYKYTFDFCQFRKSVNVNNNNVIACKIIGSKSASETCTVRFMNCTFNHSTTIDSNSVVKINEETDLGKDETALGNLYIYVLNQLAGYYNSGSKDGCDRFSTAYTTISQTPTVTYDNTVYDWTTRASKRDLGVRRS